MHLNDGVLLCCVTRQRLQACVKLTRVEGARIVQQGSDPLIDLSGDGALYKPDPLQKNFLELRLQKREVFFAKTSDPICRVQCRRILQNAFEEILLLRSELRFGLGKLLPNARINQTVTFQNPFE